MKRIICLLLMLTLPLWNLSCTSTDSDSESEAKSTADEISEEAGEAQSVASEGEEEKDNEGDDDDDSEEDQSADVDEGEEDGEELAEEDGEENVEKELAEVEEEEFENDNEETSKKEVAKNDAVAEQVAEQAPPAVPGDEEKVAAQEEQPQQMSSNEEMPPPARSPSGFISLKKVASAPFKKNGVLLNSVYILRPNDTISSVSQKIYGSDKSDEILTNNPHLSTTTQPGNKLYYNSPTRPTDEATMMTYYEDKGIPAETYTAKEGDNIREVASTLLGFPEAWKEVWSVNSVESKQFLSGGETLKYWKSDAAAPVEAKLASNAEPTIPTLDGSATQSSMSPTPDSLGEESLSSEGAAGTTASLPPPPPPPPPPINQETPVFKEPNTSQGNSFLGSESSNWVLGGVALAALAFLVYFSVQKKNRKQMDFEYTTQA